MSLRTGSVLNFSKKALAQPQESLPTEAKEPFLEGEKQGREEAGLSAHLVWEKKWGIKMSVKIEINITVAFQFNKNDCKIVVNRGT